MPLPEEVLGGPAQLTWYIGQDDCLYAHELQTDCLFKIYEDVSELGPEPAPAGVPEAPTDGKLYGRENAAWNAVPTSSGLSYPLEAPVQIHDANGGGTGADVSNALKLATFGGIDVQSRGFELDAGGGDKFFTASDSTGRIEHHATYLKFYNNSAKTVNLWIDATSGDLMADNGVKQVNLTNFATAP